MCTVDSVTIYVELVTCLKHNLISVNVSLLLPFLTSIKDISTCLVKPISTLISATDKNLHAKHSI